jgi:Uncharacterized protein conserved in bacteria (DUF2087)
MNPTLPAPQPTLDPTAALAALVVKDGLGLGRLADAPRTQLLGLVWAGLPRLAMSEAAVNTALKAQLAGAARCIDTDHVELRRWLCDAGWLQRDGWGREYRRAALAQLPEPVQALGAALEAGFDAGGTAVWVDGLRNAREATRAARRRAHERGAAATGSAAR